MSRTAGEWRQWRINTFAASRLFKFCRPLLTSAFRYSTRTKEGERKYFRIKRLKNYSLFLK
jgi:hypothetical protein